MQGVLKFEKKSVAKRLMSALDGSEWSTSSPGRPNLQPLHGEKSTGWAPEPVWMLLKKDKSLVPSEETKRVSLAVQCAYESPSRVSYLAPSGNQVLYFKLDNFEVHLFTL